MTEHLLRKAKKGDHDAFCALMDTQTQSMYKIARTYLQNDEDAADDSLRVDLGGRRIIKKEKTSRSPKTLLPRIMSNT